MRKKFFGSITQLCQNSPSYVKTIFYKCTSIKSNSSIDDANELFHKINKARSVFPKVIPNNQVNALHNTKRNS